MRPPKICDNCSVSWTRDHNVKDIVLCRLHATAPALLAALERLAPVSCQAEAYASPLYDAGLRCDQQGRPVQTWCVACYARAAIAAAKESTATK